MRAILEYTGDSPASTPTKDVTTWTCSSGWQRAREFVWGDSARFPEPLAMLDHTGSGLDEPPGWEMPVSGIVYHYLHDALGSVIGLTNSAGTMVERYTYDPYGKTFVEHWRGNASQTSGTWDPNIATGGAMSYSAFGNPFMWTGLRYDAAVGMYHFWARTYSPSLGRWLQRDPMGYIDSDNLYEAVLSNPIQWVDPDGLEITLGKWVDDQGKIQEYGMYLLAKLQKLCPGLKIKCVPVDPTVKECYTKKDDPDSPEHKYKITINCILATEANRPGGGPCARIWDLINDKKRKVTMIFDPHFEKKDSRYEPQNGDPDDALIVIGSIDPEGLKGSGDSMPPHNKPGKVRDTIEFGIAHEIGHALEPYNLRYAWQFENEFRRLFSRKEVSYGQRDGTDHKNY